MDAYNKGLDAKWAAWASRKFPGHRTLPPEELMVELEAAKEAEIAAARKSTELVLNN
jgi:hypothetical protein